MVRQHQLIGLYAARPQCGKSSVAAFLQQRGYLLLPMAGTLKRMLRVLLVDLGMSDDLIHRAMNEDKEKPCLVLPGHTPRQLMQALGTQWGRQMVNEKLWVSCWMQLAQSAIMRGQKVVVDDIRFEQEARMIEELGGVLVEVMRPGGGSEAFTNHASEGALAGWPFRSRLVNDGALADLELLVENLLIDLQVEDDANN